MTTLPEKISLTDDTEQQAKLRRKLAEYDARLEFQAPEVDLHATFKQRLLKELLEQGSVDISDFRSRLTTLLGTFHEGSYSEAVKLIAAYNANDLRKVTGGTGLS